MNIKKIRKQFPMLANNTLMQGKPLVFLDNASTSLKPQCVIDAMNRYYSEATSNSHRGDYDLCYFVDKEINDTRKLVAEFVNCDVNSVVFTSGDTEALNLVAYGYALKFLKKGDGILISEIEHASNALPWFRISELTGCSIYYINTDNGKVTPTNVEKALKEHKNIKLVSIAHMSNVLGYKVDIKEVAKIVHKYDALICVDGAQSVPHFKTNFKDWDIDFLAFSAHKMCGPTGIGCLIGKEDILNKMDPFITGGGMNVTFSKDKKYEPLPAPVKFEAGTQNIAGIYGFGAAIKFLMSIGMDEIEQREKQLRSYLNKKLENQDNIVCVNPDSDSGIFTFNVKNVFAQDEGTLLNSKGIAVRTGKHCAKMIDDVINEIATIRVSLYFYTTEEEIDALVDALINGGDILDAYFN